MRVFVTGATGWVGAAVLAELKAHGHEVLALCRSSESARAVAAAGAEAISGGLDDLDVLIDGAGRCDAIVHTAFRFDATRLAECCEEEALAIQAMSSAFIGSERPLLVSSGFAGTSDGSMLTEDDLAPPLPPAFPRAAEKTVEALADRGIRAATIRLAPSVHGNGDRGFVPRLIQLARKEGFAAYIDDGETRWPAVHVSDAARLYRLVLEKGVTRRRYHAVADEGVPLREIARAIAAGLGVPEISLPFPRAQEYFGEMTMFVASDRAASSAKTRLATGWAPVGPSLLDDISGAHYYL
jgi:nucleoside-diphosphate-sugar epimerase